jgi:hypothetical protein
MFGSIQIQHGEGVELCIRRAQCSRADLAVLGKNGIIDGCDLGIVDVDSEPALVEVKEIDRWTWLVWQSLAVSLTVTCPSTVAICSGTLAQ